MKYNTQNFSTEEKLLWASVGSLAVAFLLLAISQKIRQSRRSDSRITTLWSE